MNKFERWVRQAGASRWESIPRRAAGAAARKSGLRRRLRPGGEQTAEQLQRHFVDGYDASQATERWRQRANGFLFGPRRGPALSDALRWLIPDDVWAADVEGVGAALERGQLKLYDHRFADVGWPPDFQRDPVNGGRWPTLKHWSDYDPLDPATSDIRGVQEPSRFSVAFHLGRQVLRAGDDDAAERFWQLFEAWDAQNPYGLTVQWQSAREAAYRLFAWLFASVATLDRPAATPERLHRMTERAWYVAHHADGALGEARGRRDLDVFACAAALWTVGALFDELRPSAAWKARGRRRFELEILQQVNDDGTYGTDGPWALRTFLDQVLWSARLGELTGHPLAESTLEPVGAAFRWLIELTDPDSGRVPNMGANDGTHLLPLSTCAYGDMRPTLQAVSYLLYRRRAFAEGPWDEKMLWLFGPDALDADVGTWPRRGSSLAGGGYETFVGPETWGLVRCGRVRDRPSHADMLHLDLWHRGWNLLRDAGTLQAYPDGRRVRYGLSTAAHNVVELDGEDQMVLGPRLRWLRWTKGRFLRRRRSTDGRIDIFAGAHLGYARLPGRPVHRRMICRIDDAWIVVDDVLGSGEHEAVLRWRLYPTEWAPRDDAWVGRLDERTEWRLRAALPETAEAEIVSGVDDERLEGWEALHYGELLAVPVWRASVRARLPLRFVTCLDAPGAPLTVADDAGPGGTLTLDGLGGATTSLAELADETFRAAESDET